MNKTRLSIIATVLATFAGGVNAKFFVDYQGLDIERERVKQERIESAAEDEKNTSFKSDYVVLADKSLNVLEQIGKPRPTSTSVFGADTSLKDAMILIMPDNWISYIHKDLKNISNVDFAGNNQNWTKVLANIGVNYGFRFIVDWNKEQIQVLKDPTFTTPDFTAPIAYKDDESGRVIYVYSENPNSPNNSTTSIVVNGEAIPVKLTE